MLVRSVAMDMLREWFTTDAPKSDRGHDQSEDLRSRDVEARATSLCNLEKLIMASYDADEHEAPDSSQEEGMLNEL